MVSTIIFIVVVFLINCSMLIKPRQKTKRIEYLYPNTIKPPSEPLQYEVEIVDSYVDEQGNSIDEQELLPLYVAETIQPGVIEKGDIVMVKIINPNQIRSLNGYFLVIEYRPQIYTCAMGNKKIPKGTIGIILWKYKK